MCQTTNIKISWWGLSLQCVRISCMTLVAFGLRVIKLKSYGTLADTVGGIWCICHCRHWATVAVNKPPTMFALLKHEVSQKTINEAYIYNSHPMLHVSVQMERQSHVIYSPKIDSQFVKRAPFLADNGRHDGYPRIPCRTGVLNWSMRTPF